jgi:4-hydroxybenzoate polyprenyltransferase
VKARTLLELGRVSNLPTVLSNVLCGAALSGERLRVAPLVLATSAGALFYVGGMFLNDAFDAEIDARERPERPIPSGRATRKGVLGMGLGLLAAGLILLGIAAFGGFAPSGAVLFAAGIVTALAVVAYDRWHKGFALSPVIMGVCRAGLYVIGALAVSDRLDYGVVLAAITLLLYVVGLTHIARFENASALGRAWPTAFVFAPVALALTSPIVRVQGGRFVLLLAATSALWSLRALLFAKSGGRSIGRAVVSLIAGISLLDALFAATRAELGVTALSLGCTALTLLLQRQIRGT